MLALKKKREAERKQAAEEEAAAATTNNNNGGGTTATPPTLSLLGVGGKKQVKNGDSATAVKKRTPGEIRIQKGSFVLLVALAVTLLKSVVS